MRIFNASPQEPDAPGPEFAIADHKFRARAYLPAGALSNLFYAGQASDLPARAVGFINLIRAALPGEQQDEFTDLVYGQELQVGIELLEEIATWLVEELCARPTTPSSGSLAGSTPTPATSEGGSGESGES